MKARHALLLAVLGVVLGLGTAAAQTGAVATPQQRQTERERIAHERARQEAQYQQAERACYQRFAVNDCLRQARARRRSALDELRRQEIILNELERQAQAQGALERIEGKITEHAPQPSASTGR